MATYIIAVWSVDEIEYLEYMYGNKSMIGKPFLFMFQQKLNDYNLKELPNKSNC